MRNGEMALTFVCHGRLALSCSERAAPSLPIELKKKRRDLERLETINTSDKKSFLKKSHNAVYWPRALFVEKPSGFRVSRERESALTHVKRNFTVILRFFSTEI